MSIDDSVGRDPRITRLAARLGLDRDLVVGRLVTKVWPICYDQMTAIVAVADIDAVAGSGFAAAMLEVGLGRKHQHGVWVAGASARIEYLRRQKVAGSKGGVASGLARLSRAAKPPTITTTSNDRSSTARTMPQALANLPDPVPDPAPVVVPDSEINPPETPLPGGIPKPGSKSKPITDAETASVRRVLDKLGDVSGVAYRGSRRHTQLVVDRMRAGVSEFELRFVVGYCARELGWAAEPDDGERDMRPYLRPETLFGPQTIERYLDAARTWARRHPELWPDDATPPADMVAKPSPARAPTAFDDPRWTEPDWMLGRGAS